MDSKLMSGGMNCVLSMCDTNYSDRLDKHQQIDDAVPTNEIREFDQSRNILFTEINRSIKIYAIHNTGQTKTLLRTVKAANDSHLQSWASAKGFKYLAYSTNTETRILKTQFTKQINKSITVDMKRFNATDYENSYKAHGESASLPASYLLKFALTASGKQYLLLVESVTANNLSDNNSKLHIYEIDAMSAKPALVTSILAKEENNFNGIHKLVVSDNGNVIAFSTLDGLLFIYSLEKLQMIKKIARQPNPNRKDTPRIVCMKFNAKATNLVAVYSHKKVLKMSVHQNTNTKWCNTFNSNIRKEWANLCPREISFIDDQKLAVLMTKGLIVQLNMEKVVGLLWRLVLIGVL